MPCTNYSAVQVSISSTETTSAASVVSSTSRLGVWSLPRNVQRSFSDAFAPRVIAEMGCSSSPWSRLDVDTVQSHINFLYTGYEYTIEDADEFDTSVRARTL
jgi:hypothetical protein